MAKPATTEGGRLDSLAGLDLLLSERDRTAGQYALWARREVTEERSLQAISEIKSITRLISPDRFRQIGKTTMTLLYPQEAMAAIRQSRLEQPPDAQQIAEAILELEDTVLAETVTAQITGLSQFQQNIALKVEYQAYHHERSVLNRVIQKLLNSHYRILPDCPHISILVGSLVDFRRRVEPLVEIPQTVELSPARVSVRNRDVHSHL